MPSKKSAPSHLSNESKALWRQLVTEYAIGDVAGLSILRTALEAFDRMRSATAAIKTEGETSLDRFGQRKAHPLLAVERDSRAAFLAALKALNLDLEPLRDRAGRPGKEL